MTSKIIPDVEVATLLYNSGWTGYDCVRVLQALIAENNLDAYALNPLNKPGKADDKSVDVGLCSLNTHWIPEPTLWERLNPERSIQWSRVYWDRWFKRPEVLALPFYADRRDYVLKKMWHAVETPRYEGATFFRSVAAIRAAGVPEV